MAFTALTDNNNDNNSIGQLIFDVPQRNKSVWSADKEEAELMGEDIRTVGVGRRRVGGGGAGGVVQTGMSTLPRGWSRRSQGAPEECHAAFLSLKESVSLSRSGLPWSDGIPLPAICPSRQSSRAAIVAKSPGFSSVTKCFEASFFFFKALVFA